MKNAIKVFILATMFFATSQLSFKVSADAGSQCVVGTGVNGIPCQPCYTGPYNICAPQTGIIFADENLDNLEIALMMAPVLIGLVLVLNGKVLQSSETTK